MSNPTSCAGCCADMSSPVRGEIFVAAPSRRINGAPSGRHIPLLTELLPYRDIVSTPMPPLTGLAIKRRRRHGHGSRLQKQWQMTWERADSHIVLNSGLAGARRLRRFRCGSLKIDRFVPDLLDPKRPEGRAPRTMCECVPTI